MEEHAVMAIRAGAELTLSLLQRTMWSDICTTIILQSAPNGMLNSPEHPHAQPFNMVCPSPESRPSHHRYRIPQSHLPHSSSIQCRPALPSFTFNLLCFRSSGLDGVQVVPGDGVLLRFPHCGLVGL